MLEPPTPAKRQRTASDIGLLVDALGGGAGRMGAIDIALASVVAAVDGTAAALVEDDAITAMAGQAGGAAAASLLDVVAGRLSAEPPDGIDPADVVVAPLASTGGAMAVVRHGRPFSQDEVLLVQTIAGVVDLALRAFDASAAELDQRARWDEQAGEKEALLASLQERQVLIECLFDIQRAISRREPIQTVLDAVTAGTAKLLGAEVVALRLVDAEAAGHLRLVSNVGVDPLLLEAIDRIPVGEGVGGQAMSEGQPVIADLHGATSSPLHPLIQTGLHSAMAVPVHRDGRVVGSLLVASYDGDRSYVPADQEVLLAFAEHASLALNDASAAEAIRQAYAVALRQATRDPLTDLANRTLILDRIREAVARGEATGAAPAVLFVDLDGFKKINDSLGHAVGDEVLIRISDRLLGAVRPDDVVARLGGDEFVVLCEGLDERATCQIAECVLRAIAEPLPVYGRSVVLTASVGIARANGPHQAEDLLRDADVAMYKAKAAGPGRMEVFDQDVRIQMLERLEIEQSLRRALEREELRVHFQPVVEVASGATVGAEALVRWEHPQHGFVMPSSFVHVAEEAGLIVSIGAWVLEEACRERARWEAAGLCGPGHRVSVNLSARQFADPGLFAAVEGALGTSGLAGGALCLELTESVLMDDADATLATLVDLRRLGVQLAVDDFGTGYSSLSYLTRFVVDELKIDQGFVRGLGVERGDEVMVRAIVGLAAALGLEVVAEGVETPEQLAVLRSLGCHRAQGYLFGRPGPGWQTGAHW